jgi:hypothetical protein
MFYKNKNKNNNKNKNIESKYIICSLTKVN